MRHTGYGACPSRATGLAFRLVGSGVIYAFLVVGWAGYFIPRWLRRHDELSAARSVEKFDRAMHILSGRDPVPAQRSRARRPAVSPVAMRRRRVLAGLLLATAVAVLLVPVTPVPWWAALLVLAVTATFVVHCRLQVRTSHEVSRTRAAVRKRSLSRLVRFDAIERLMTVRRELAEDRAAEEQRWLDAEQADRRERETELACEAEAADGWQPVPVPLPTYVNKPRAPRRAPTVEPFDQHEQRPPMSALLEDADEAEGQLEAILSRRAVND